MSNPKVLVCLDFDKTLVDSNTDLEIKSLANGKAIPEEIEARYDVSKDWIEYMGELFKFLFKNNVTKEDYICCLNQIPLVEGMRDLLLQLHQNGDYEIIILSDANSFFVQNVLRHHEINGTISKIFTNPAVFDKEGCLQIWGLQNQSYCTRCPPNLCKGSIMNNYRCKRMQDGVRFVRTFYIGDGCNDVCAALKLKDDDFVFPRSGYSLLRSLETKMASGDVKATVVSWETGYDIKSVLLSI